MSSWAAKLKIAPKPPTPEDRLRALKSYYATLSPKQILSEALGCYNPMLLSTPEIAKPLVEHTVVICVDTESHTLNTDQMTELGLASITRKTARDASPPGPHGWRLQEALRFLHFRVVEHAHLKSNRVDSLGPLGNRFGETRFSTFAELRLVLEHLFNQLIDSSDPRLRGCKCPVVLVGHALKHDTENANKKGLEYNIENNSTVVAKVDTQALAREVGVWIPPPRMATNEIGLRTLIETLGFLHRDDHTACNDAARTMMCAIHMVLPDHLRRADYPSMQAVADRVEARSRITSAAPYGTAECCTRCGGRDHSAPACLATVHCTACDRFDTGPDHEDKASSHIETYCPHVAKFKAWARRYRDAAAKNRAPTAEVAAGPGQDAHPWSTWPRQVKWPLVDLKDVLVGFDMISRNTRFQEPPAAVENLVSALGRLSAPGVSNGVAKTVTLNGVSKAATTGKRSSSFKATNRTYRALPPPSDATASKPAVTTTAARAPAGTKPARKQTTMSEQRSRARLAPGESKRGGESGQGRCGLSSVNTAARSCSGEMSSSGSWW